MASFPCKAGGPALHLAFFTIQRLIMIACLFPTSGWELQEGRDPV